MTKKEIIWREILYKTINEKKVKFTQKELAQKYGFSLSTVFNALKIPRDSGFIKVTGRSFEIQDLEKFLYFWATHRRLNKDVIYETNVSKTVREIEGEMPPKIIFGAFSAYFRRYHEVPADYDKVYVYAEDQEVSKIKNRFPSKKGYSSLIVLKADSWLKEFGELTPDCQTFVDLWNLPEWYAKDFLNALKERIIE